LYHSFLCVGSSPRLNFPSAILFDAWEKFQPSLAKADESIRSIRPELAAAVDEVIDAAGHEWEPAWQRKLLNVLLVTCGSIAN